MMVVEVYMLPGGDPARKQLLTQASFSLAGQDANGLRSYNVRLYKAARFGGPAAGEPLGAVVPKRKVWKEGLVTGHPGARGRPPRGEFDLIGGALAALLDGRLDPYRRER